MVLRFLVIDFSKKDILGETVESFLLKDDRKVDFHTLKVKDGMPWLEVWEIYNKNKSNDTNGFYFEFGNNIPVLAVKSSTGNYKHIVV